MGYPLFDAKPIGLRRFLAQNLSLSKIRYPYAKPHAYVANDIDITFLEKIRAQYKDRFKKEFGVPLRLDLFFIWWLIKAALKWPILNSCYAVETDENNKIKKEEIRIYRSINLGVAVAHPRQLLTIAILEAEKKTFQELAVLLDAIYKTTTVENPQKSLINKLEIGTTTLVFNNAGALGAEYGFSIIDPGASLILTIHLARNVLTWRKILKFLPLLKLKRIVFTAVSFDHRPLDGKETAADLLQFIKHQIEDPQMNKKLIPF